MKRQSFKMVLTSGLVFLLLGVAAPLTYGAPPQPQGPISLPFSGTVFNKCTGEDVDITGEVHILSLLKGNHISTAVFLKSYDAVGVTTSAAYAVASPSAGEFGNAQNHASEDPFTPTSVQADFPLTLYGVVQEFQKWIRCGLSRDDLLHIELFFSADGFLTGWSTSLNGTTCTKDPCIPPQ